MVSSKAHALHYHLYLLSSRAVVLPSTTSKLAELLGVTDKSISPELRTLFANGLVRNNEIIRNVLEVQEGSYDLLTGPFKPLIEELLLGMYKDRRLDSRKYRLSPTNTLFMCVLLSFSDDQGNVTNLSQSTMRKLTGMSPAQLKSQFKKLKSLSLLITKVRGGAFESGLGRIPSSYFLRIEFIRKTLSFIGPMSTYRPHDKKADLHLYEVEIYQTNPFIFSTREQGERFLSLSIPFDPKCKGQYALIPEDNARRRAVHQALRGEVLKCAEFIITENGHLIEQYQGTLDKEIINKAMASDERKVLRKTHFRILKKLAITVGLKRSLSQLRLAFEEGGESVNNNPEYEQLSALITEDRKSLIITLARAAFIVSFDIAQTLHLDNPEVNFRNVKIFSPSEKQRYIFVAGLL